MSPPQIHAQEPSNNTPSLTRRALRPVISQAYICDLWIEQNNTCWPDERGNQSRFFGYCRENKSWHSRKLLGPDFWTSNWQRDQYCVPFEDYVPDVIASIREVIAPHIETASPADQRRLGSFPFLTGCFRMLQLSSDVVVTRNELLHDEAPRWMCEEQAMERQSRSYA